MRKEKSFKMINLVKLYLSFIFQKTTIIVFSISLILILGIEIYLANPFINTSDYLQGYKEIHLIFFTQSFFIIQIFNSVIISTITISLTINANSFDTLFLSHTPRFKLCLAKLISSFIVILLLIIYETIIINLIPFFCYPLYKITPDILLSLLYLYSSTITEAVLSYLISTLIPVVLIPMLFMFISIVIKLLSNNFTNFRLLISRIIPLVNITYDGIKCDAIILAPIWIILFSMLYLSVYSIKDLKQ